MTSLHTIELATEPAALARLGLHVRDDHAVVGGVALRAMPGEGRGGITGLGVDGVRDGVLPPCRGGPVPASDTAAEHPLGATAVDHVVVLCGDVDGALAAMGVEARRREERDGRVYAYVVARTALLELVGPVAADDRPPRPWGLALTVGDLDAAAAQLGEACGAPRDAFQPGRRIATVRHETLGLGVPTVLLSPRVR